MTDMVLSRGQIYVLLYYLATIAVHKPVNDFSVYLSNLMTLPEYNSLIKVMYYCFTGMFFLFFIARLQKNRVKTALIWLCFFSMIELANNTLLVVNAEKIHYIQYGILAILLMRLNLDSRAVFVSAAFLGFSDEIYQYVVLNGSLAERYIDFNDMLLNILGAVGGLLLVMTFSGKVASRSDHRSFGILLVKLLAAVALILTGFALLDFILNGSAGFNAFFGTTRFSFDISAMKDSGLLSTYHVLSLSEFIVFFTVVFIVFDVLLFRFLEQSQYELIKK